MTITDDSTHEKNSVECFHLHTNLHLYFDSNYFLFHPGTLQKGVVPFAVWTRRDTLKFDILLQVLLSAVSCPTVRTSVPVVCVAVALHSTYF